MGIIYKNGKALIVTNSIKSKAILKTKRREKDFINEDQKKKILQAASLGLPIERAFQSVGIDPFVFRYWVDIDEKIKSGEIKDEDVQERYKYEIFKEINKTMGEIKANREANILVNMHQLADGEYEYVDKTIKYKILKDEEGNIIKDDKGLVKKEPINIIHNEYQGRKSHQSTAFLLEKVYKGYENENNNNQENGSNNNQDLGVQGVIVLPAKINEEEWQEYAIKQQQELIERKRMELGE